MFHHTPVNSAKMLMQTGLMNATHFLSGISVLTYDELLNGNDDAFMNIGLDPLTIEFPMTMYFELQNEIDGFSIDLILATQSFKEGVSTRTNRNRIKIYGAYPKEGDIGTHVNAYTLEEQLYELLKGTVPEGEFSKCIKENSDMHEIVSSLSLKLNSLNQSIHGEVISKMDENRA